MLRKILVATDLSERSENAIRRAAQLGRELGAELIILHVVEEDRPASLLEAEKQQAAALLDERMRTSEELGGLPVHVSVETGDVFKTILSAAKRHAVDLIVMGTHRRRLLHDIMIGTTIERVMRVGGFPVLMAVHAPTQAYRYILAAVDLSESSARALQVSQALGLLRERDVKVLYAYRAMAKDKMIYAGVSQEQIQEHVAQSAREAMAQLKEFTGRLGLEGARAGTFVDEGEPVRVLRQTLERERPDLLIIGTRGHTGLKKILLGSVADSLLREAECDILAVPP
jgi:universal stress protein E